MHIWLISAFEPLPIDQTRPMRFMGIAGVLHQRGHKVTFWSSTYNHFTKSQRYPADQEIEVKPDYELRLVYAKPYRRNISLGRLLSHGDYAKNMIKNLRSETKPDLIYLAFPPIRLFEVVADYSSSHQVPLVVDIIDPWPDVFLNVLPDYLKRPSRIFLAGFYHSLKNSFASCRAVFSISETYLQWAQKLIDQPDMIYKVFYPAVDTSAYPFLDSKKIKRPIRFIYAGTLGASYDVGSILKVARNISSGDAEFVIAGDGPERKKLEWKAKSIPHVHFKGWLNGVRLRKELSAADIGIAAYRKRGTQTVTYKLFDYLSAGLPIIFSLDGEMRSIIEKNDLGCYYVSENPKNLRLAIEKYINMDPEKLLQQKRHARDYAEKEGDIDVVYEKLVKTLEEILEDSN